MKEYTLYEAARKTGISLTQFKTAHMAGVFQLIYRETTEHNNYGKKILQHFITQEDLDAFVDLINEGKEKGWSGWARPQKRKKPREIKAEEMEWGRIRRAVEKKLEDLETHHKVYWYD